MSLSAHKLVFLPLCLSALLIGLSTPIQASDWPQYRGPDRTGITDGSGLAEAWPEEGPVELWRRDVGSGFSAISVVGDTAYTMEAVDAEEAILALDAATGETRWRTVVGEPMESEFGRGPRATPTLAGGRLFTVSSQSTLVALDAKTGDVLWQKDLTAYGPPPRFGYSSSPLVLEEAGHEGIVVVDVGTQDLMDSARADAETKAREDDPEVEPEITVPPQIGAIAGFDAETGDMKWRGGFPGGAGYTAPIVLTLGGVPQMVFVRRDSAVGVDFQGNALWTFPTDPTAAIAMPVQLSDDVFFMSTSDDHFGGKAIRVSRAEDGTWSAEEAWAERLMRNHFNTSVALDGVLYGFDNTTFKALDAATGKRLWAHRGFGKGSLLAAGDLLYVLGDTGELALVQATGEDYVQLGNVQAMQGKAWTSPSLAGGTIFLRDHDEMVAYDVRASTLAQRASGPSEAAEASSQTATVSTDDTEIAAAREAAKKAAALSADQLLARYVEARGGKEAWSKVKTLSMSGHYEAFSEPSDFVLHRARRQGQDLFYLRYHLFEVPGIRAVDAEGPWLQHKFLSPTPLRVASVEQIAPYVPQMLREAHFGPLLLDAEELGLKLETAGVGEINGRPTIDLKVTFPVQENAENAADDAAEDDAEDDAEGDTEAEEAQPVVETWHLEPVTFLEVAVDSHILDYTQGGQPFLQRAYYGDFREVAGVMIPFQLDLEFNARFERMEVTSAEVNADLDDADFAMPEPPPAAAEEAEADSEG